MRYVFALARLSGGERTAFAQALVAAMRNASHCSECRAVSDAPICAICRDPKRDPFTLCVVASDEDAITLEDTKSFTGRYHILGKTFNPLERAATDTLATHELCSRIKKHTIREVVLAFNPDIEGEATIMFLARALGSLGVRLTRLARGLPMGSDLEYADPITLADALSGRREITAPRELVQS